MFRLRKTNRALKCYILFFFFLGCFAVVLYPYWFSAESAAAARAAKLIALKPGAAADFTVTGSPSAAFSGDTLTVSWTAPDGRPPNDWVGLYRVGDPSTESALLWWVFTNGTTSGSFPVAAPPQAGQYEFRYFIDETFTDVARSNTVTVSPAPGYSLTGSPSTVGPEGLLTVSWMAPSGRSSFDWVGLFRVGDPNTAYLWWNYTGGATSGSRTLSAPAQAGLYEFRYQNDDGLTTLVISNTVTVTAGVCAYSISPISQSFPSSGGTGSVAVTTQGGCSWTAGSNVSWTTITGGSSGSGNGTVSYSVAANTTTNPRTGTATIAGQNITITQAAADTDPRAFYGAWDPNIITWPNLIIDSVVLPNAKVLTWSDDVGGEGPPPGQNHFDSYVWDVATGSFTYLPVNFADAFCGGHAFLPDGRLLAAGGHIDNGIGTNTAITFDYRNNSWSAVSSGMSAARWYPTVCALSNGEMLVVTGNVDNTHGVNLLPEVLTTAGNFRILTGANLNIPLYSWMHLAPNGKVFNSGPGVNSLYLDTSGAGSWAVVASSVSGIFRDYGTSVMYEPGKVLIAGGGDPPTSTAEVINLNAPSPAWRSVSAMGFPRRQHNAVLLPDGKVLVTGGTSSPGFNDATNAVLAAEMWDPLTESWSTLASMQIKRQYHSTSVLLPDGRVLSGGGGRPAAISDVSHPNAELYSPPYLFKGARPTIGSAPASAGYGQTFFVQTPEAASITRVTLIRLPSTTHGNDMNQRFNQLSFSQAAGGLNVTAPANSNLCPPGHYMLFILNGNGVPSVAKIIQII